jgi:oxaloacetate decarboxylase alpha subunit
MTTDAECLTYQIPGGMISNLVSQLKNQNALDRLEEVLKETPLVRSDMGYPPLVTPLSQMVGAQAVSNVLMGERYKNILKEIKGYIKGEYGRPPGLILPELIKKVNGDEEPFTGRFADTLTDGMEEGRTAAGDMAKNIDDVLSYIMLPQVAENFFKNRDTAADNEIKPVEKKYRYKIERM